MTDLPIAETRAELVDALTGAGFTVTDSVPATPHPPLVIIGAGDPYLTVGDVFNGKLSLRLELFVAFKPAENSAFTAAADAMLINTLDAIPDRWFFRECSAPFKATNLGGLTACRIRVDTLTQEI